MNQISLTPYVQPLAVQPQVFYVIEKNELFHLFKEWLTMPSDLNDVPSPLVPSANSENLVPPQFPMAFIDPTPQSPTSTSSSIPPMMMPEGYYSREEVAQMLQVDKSTLWRWDKTGMLKCVKLGPRKVGYSKEAVKLFIEKRNDDGK